MLNKQSEGIKGKILQNDAISLTLRTRSFLSKPY